MTHNLSVEDVQSVYSGRDGACCCGCAGRHYYHPAFAELAERHRAKVSARMVARVVATLRAADPRDLDVCTGYIATTVGARLYIAYLRDDATQEGEES